MAILVVCPGCTSRFTVSDQFAGRTGPCPKCKKPITVPRPQAQAVTIHEPTPAAGVAGGKPVTVPFKSLDRPVSPVAFTLGGAGAVAILLVASLYKVAAGMPPPWLSLTVAFLVGIPCAAIGYAALRNREMEAYRGSALWLRCVACAAVYAALWAVRGYFFDPKETQYMWQWLVIAGPFALAGALAALASFDLDWGAATAHFSFYVLFTALLRMLSGFETPL